MSLAPLRSPPFLVACGLLAAWAVAMPAALRAYGVQTHKRPIHAPDGRQVHAIPLQTASWVRSGEDRIESADVVSTLGTDNYVTRRYVERGAPPGRPPEIVEVHVAYYTGTVDTVPHVPERCFVGGGVQIIREWGEVPVPLDPAPMRLDDALAPGAEGPIYTTRLSNEFSDAPGRRVRLPRGVTPEGGLRLRVTEFETPGGTRLLAGYFFVANGGTVASAEGVRRLAFDLRSEYAYYMKVQVMSLSARTPEDLARAAGRLLDDLLGELMRCVPDWALVESGAYPPDHPRRGRS
jgi:hypothetical protein